jgi:hypothetical protein
MITSLRPADTVQKLLISSPSSFAGEYENDFILLTHAWPDSHTGHAAARFNEGPASRSAYVFAFRTETPEKRGGVALPNYAAVGTMVCAYLSVLYGKRFDSHGLIEGTGFFHLPSLSEYFTLSDHTLPHNSHKARRTPNIEMNLGEVRALAPLFVGNQVDVSVLQTFQSASKFYLQALQTVETDAEVAYLHLITAGEVLSNAYTYPKEDLLEEKFLQYSKDIESNMVNGSDIVQYIQSRMYSVRKRFLKTLLRLLNSGFYSGSETREEWMALTKDDIEKQLLAAYDLRSKYVHAGIPFGSWVVGGSSMRSEKLMCKPVVEDADFAKVLQRAPTFMGLERVLRYCLLRYLHLNGVPISDVLADDA